MGWPKTYDDWKTTNPDDEFLGPEPPPCLPKRTRSRFDSSSCVDCGAPDGECWWQEGPPEMTDEEYERAAEDEQRRRDASEGFDE